MSTRIAEAQVRHIAELARLDLSADEVHLFAGQLAHILDYVRQLEQVDTTGVEPLVHPVPLANVQRDDVPQASLGTEAALRNAPERAGAFFKVPAVLEPSTGA